MAWTFYNSDGQRLVKQSSSGGGGDVSFGGNTFGETKVIGSNDNYNFGLETNGCTRLTVQNDGKVGIGETSPHAILHVKDGDSSICAPTNAIAQAPVTVVIVLSVEPVRLTPPDDCLTSR